MSGKSKKYIRSTNRNSTRGSLSKFARDLLREWLLLGLPVQDDRIVVAVSGGADSSALLFGLNELVASKRLAIKLVAAHLDHGLRGSASQADADWVAQFAHGLNCDVVIARANLKEALTTQSDNIEQAARRVRYEFLEETARKSHVTAVLTAHTLNDQAETVVLRLIRGSGTDGLAGIEPIREFPGNSKFILARPLLRWARRADTENYCRDAGIDFRFDEMNEDNRFARVRVRNQVIPLLRTFNPRIVETLVRTASLLSDDAAALDVGAAELLERAMDVESGAIRIDKLLDSPIALRRRALRMWLSVRRGDLRRLGSVHLKALERLIEGERGGRRVELPGGTRVARHRGHLWFEDKVVDNQLGEA